jgi:hypothetical protein
LGFHPDHSFDHSDHPNRGSSLQWRTRTNPSPKNSIFRGPATSDILKQGWVWPLTRLVNVQLGDRRRCHEYDRRFATTRKQFPRAPSGSGSKIRNCGNRNETSGPLSYSGRVSSPRHRNRCAPHSRRCRISGGPGAGLRNGPFESRTCGRAGCQRRYRRVFDARNNYTGSLRPSVWT